MKAITTPNFPLAFIISIFTFESPAAFPNFISFINKLCQRILDVEDMPEE